VHLFKFSMLCFFSLACSCVVCCCCVGIVSSVLHQETSWKEHVGNDLFCVEWDVKP